MPASHPTDSVRLRTVRAWQLWAVGLIVVAWLAGVISVGWVVPSTLLAAYDGESLPTLNEMVANHRALADERGLPPRDRAWYEQAASRYGYRVILYGSLAAITLLLAVFWRSTCRLVRGYVHTRDYALNLGVLRVAVFALLLRSLLIEPIEAAAEIPDSVRRWPALAEQALAFVPIEPWYVAAMLPVSICATVLALLGVLTRFTVPLAALTAYTLVGIPTLTGKVNHSHHVLILAMMLATTPCGDGFSLDSLWRRGRAAVVARTSRRRRLCYGIPIRLATIVLATVYFFPGFFKAACGPEWVLGDAMKNIARSIWFERETFQPLLRVDNLGALSVFGAAATIIFEMGFLPALFFRRTRMVLAASGLMFHNMTNLTLGISFYSLQWMYVSFVDWYASLRWIGRRCGPSELTIYYDGGCGLCRRTMNVLLELDWLHCLRPEDVLRLSEDNLTLVSLGADRLLADMHAHSGSDDPGRYDAGYDAYKRIAARVPLFWPLVPLMALPPVASIGRTIYRRVADSRACRVQDRPSAPSLTTRPRWTAWPILGIFSIAWLGLIGTGLTKTIFAWPVACYPTFDTVGSPTKVWPKFLVETEGGREYELEDDPIRERYGSARYVQVLYGFVFEQEPEVDAELVGQLLAVWREVGAIDPADPPQRIEVRLERYTLTGATRPTEADAIESREFFRVVDGAVEPESQPAEG